MENRKSHYINPFHGKYSKSIRSLAALAMLSGLLGGRAEAQCEVANENLFSISNCRTAPCTLSASTSPPGTVFGFTVPSGCPAHDVSVTISELQADLDLYLLSDQCLGNGVITRDNLPGLLESSLSVGTSDDTVRRSLLPGTYYVGVLPFNDVSSSYRIDFRLNNNPACAGVGGAPTLANISAIGVGSSSSPFIACTIIGNPGARIVVLAERRAGNIDPDLYFAPLGTPLSQVRSTAPFSNDDFAGTVPIINRSLGSPLDSALIVSGIQGPWCAYAYSLSGSGEISIQLGDEAGF